MRRLALLRRALRRRARVVSVIVAVVPLVVSMATPQVLAAPLGHGKAKRVASHPDWRPKTGKPAPIIEQTHSSRGQVPFAKRQPAHRVHELVNMRRANARYYQMSDGTVQAAVSAGTLNYRDAQGHFQPIDTTVSASSKPGFAYGNDRNVFGSHFGRDRANLVQVDLAGHTLTVGTPDAAPALSPVASGNTVTYRGALSGADLDYDVASTGLRERIVLPRASKDPTYTFTVDLGGLSAKQRSDGSIALYGEGSDPVAVMPKPFMYDSAPDRNSPYGTVWSPKVTQTMTANGGTLTITVRADKTWLDDGHRVYPVTIDPTIKIAPTVTQSQDAMILSDSPSSNFDGNWRLSVGTTDVAKARSLVKFDLSTIPAGTQIDSAQLRLYYDQTFTSDASAVPIEAHRVTAPWDETTVTWNSINTALGELGR
jgi:hypothetical protein